MTKREPNSAPFFFVAWPSAWFLLIREDHLAIGQADVNNLRGDTAQSIKLGCPRLAKRDRSGRLVNARAGIRLVRPLHRVADLQFNRRFFVPDEDKIILLQVLVVRIGGVLHQPQRVLATKA